MASIVSLVSLTYTGCKASLLTSMSSMNGETRLTRMIRSGVTIGMERLSGWAMLGRLYRKTIMDRQPIYITKYISRGYSDARWFRLFLASVSFRGLPACPCRGVGIGNPKPKRCISRGNSDSGRGYSICSLRELPWASVSFRAHTWDFRCVHVGASGTASRIPNAVFPGNIRILGGYAIFSYR